MRRMAYGRNGLSLIGVMRHEGRRSVRLDMSKGRRDLSGTPWLSGVGPR
jgi:hypothetical protein